MLAKQQNADAKEDPIENEVDEKKQDAIEDSKMNSMQDDGTDGDMYALFNVIQFQWDKLFIDIRPKTEYEKIKITQFINMPFDILDDNDCDEILIEQLMNAKRRQFEQNTFTDSNSILIPFDVIYIISNKENIENKNNMKFSTYLQTIIRDTFDTTIPIIVLNVAFNIFYQKFPFLCYRNKAYDILKYPSMILNDELFLGNMTHATTKQVLVDLNITHIINMTTQFSCQMFDYDKDLKIKYLNIPIYDSEEVQIQRYFEKGIKFISQALSENNNNNNNIKNRVLVHCQAGVSRSASMVIAYLMKNRQFSFENAYKYTQNRREIIEPNDGFVEQLKLYQKNNFIVKNIKNDDGILGYFK